MAGPTDPDADDPPGEPSEVLFGWLQPGGHALRRPQDSNDAIVVSDADGTLPRVLARYTLGTLEVALVSAGRAHVEPLRSARQWRGVILGHLVSGRLSVTQGERTVHLGAGDSVLYTGAHPYAITAHGPHEFLLVRIPTAVIALRHGEFTNLLAADLGGLPSAALLRAILGTLIPPETRPSPAAGAHVADALVAAVHAVLADGRSEATAHVLSLFHSLVLWIEENLHEPDLSARALARAHGLSVRRVRDVFAENGVTVSALVRERRLERIREDLVDGAGAHDSIGTIAARWAFGDPATLSSAFTRRYGVSPRRYRALHMTQGQPGADDDAI